jgi:hypothetical protein
VGLRRAWVFDCDAKCSRRLILAEPGLLAVRREALAKGWETVLRVGSQDTTVAWFCPRHWHEAAGETIAPEDHEGWCPRRTRRGACACEVSARDPHMTDDAYGSATARRVAGVTTVWASKDYL